ncbi:thiolase family protein [Alicyclobacillus tolerans]|uniref:thiolase family protein n=1 Tax=Alicyclobacillus tolerans TaxID=90970 RepID=UPI001F483F5D|nr:thiolase family protein [Alicyclobacillus tolerans]MCF8566859.1 thiolase family protein [Alicyclobacillus tolerans]
MQDAIVLGVGMTQFGKRPDATLKDLTREAVLAALSDAAIEKSAIEAAYVGNSVAGITTGQETIRGQVVLRPLQIEGIPIFNIENACASSSTALHLASVGIRAGMHDCVLVLGVEKMTHPDRNITFKAFEGGVDVEELQQYQIQDAPDGTPSRSIFMDVYAKAAREYLQQFGATPWHLAQIAAKNHANGALNPYAQYRFVMSPEDVLKDRMVVDPLTRSMCAPISDGAAAVILASPRFARQMTRTPVVLAASAVKSTHRKTLSDPGVIHRTSQTAYDAASLGPQDIGVFEVHDTTAAAELMAYEELGLCSAGEAARLVDENRTALGGATPVNPSGGLECKGHPIGATGLGQIVELTWQLRGQAGPRQVLHRGEPPLVALAQNAGGHLGIENATCAITILQR